MSERVSELEKKLQAAEAELETSMMNQEVVLTQVRFNSEKAKAKAADVRAIGLSGQMHGSVVLGDVPKPLRPALRSVLGLVCGVGLGIYAIGTLGNNMVVRAPAEALAVMSGMLSVVVWSMIFFRAQGEIRQVA